MYKLIIPPKVEKTLKKLDKHESKKIYNWLKNKIEGCSDPRQHGKALTANLSGLWRYRIEDYRVIVKIVDDELIIVAVSIDHRKQIYK